MSIATTTKGPRVATLSIEDIKPQEARRGRPAVYTAEERKERAKAATRRSAQKRINRQAEMVDKIIEAITTINVTRLSREDKAVLAGGLQEAVNLRAKFVVKPVDGPDSDFADDTDGE